MKAVLLAAGIGERLRPFTESSPKCLVDVGGRSLLFRHLDLLSALPEIDGAVGNPWKIHGFGHVVDDALKPHAGTILW